jgi:hypothetical protein
MLVNHWTIGTKVNSCDDDKLNLRLRRSTPGTALHVQPRTEDEPLFRTYGCGSVTVKNGARFYASTGELVVTAKRVLVLLRQGSTGKGSEKFTVVSINRAELRTPASKADRRGRVTSVELSAPDGGSVSVSSQTTKLAGFLQSLAEPAASLGPEAAAARREAKQREAEQKLEAERKAKEEKVQQAAARFQDRSDVELDSSAVSLTAGSIFDHRKTWHYRVAASGEDCVRAFAAAFSGGGGVLLRAKWEVRTQPSGAVAMYRGRRGVIGAATALSQMASAEQQGADGSQVKFEVVGPDDDHMICAMWLASYGSRLGFTNDARFFRPYMRAVEDQLRRLDPSVQVVKE